MAATLSCVIGFGGRSRTALVGLLAIDRTMALGSADCHPSRADKPGRERRRHTIAMADHDTVTVPCPSTVLSARGASITVNTSTCLV